MPFLTLRNYETKRLTMLNTRAIVSVHVDVDTHDRTNPAPMYLVIEQTNRTAPELYFPIDERGREDWKQTDPEQALSNVRAAIAKL